MKAPKFLCSVAALAFSFTASQAVETDPVGFVSVTIPATSDAVLAVPLTRPSAFAGVIKSIAGNVVTISGTPGWTTDQFIQSLPTQTNTYALQIASGAKEGLTGIVTAHTIGTDPTLTITLDSAEDLTGIGSVALPVDPDGAGPLTSQADLVDIIPYWTPSTLVSGIVPPGTNILLFPTATTGVNLSAGTILVYTGVTWLNTGDFSNAANAPLGFSQGFIMRNNSAAAITVSCVGSVPMAKHRTIIRTFAADASQDHWISYSSPIPTPIGSSGLGFSPGDNLLVFDNSASGQNKSASQILVYTGAAWLDTNGFANVSATFNLQPGFGYILRKAQTASAQNFVWQNLQTYLQ